MAREWTGRIRLKYPIRLWPDGLPDLLVGDREVRDGVARTARDLVLLGRHVAGLEAQREVALAQLVVGGRRVVRDPGALSLIHI